MRLEQILWTSNLFISQYGRRLGQAVRTMPLKNADIGMVLRTSKLKRK